MKSNLLGAQRGFNIIELMVTFLIIAVLAAIAYPQYREYMNQGRRAEATAALLDGAQKLERFYSAHTTGYLNGGALAGVYQTKVPASGTAYYTISAAAATATTYTLQAVPEGVMEGDKCGTLTITHSGAQDVTNATVDRAVCWRR